MTIESQSSKYSKHERVSLLYGIVWNITSIQANSSTGMCATVIML